MADLPSLDPTMSFDQACAAVVAYLQGEIPFGSWSVTRYDGADQVLLAVEDRQFGLAAGDRFPWSETLCQHATSGAAPQIAPDVRAVASYAAMEVARQLPIGAYVGIPITRADGSLFGTLCGVDAAPQSPHIRERAPLLSLLCMLLASVLEADLSRTEAADRVARAEMLADTDPLTGLANRRGWERFLEREEARHRRFGDPGCVVVLDLDRLKEVNDRDGHRAGDALLRSAARALGQAVRSTDLAARLGGDGFGVIAPRCTLEQAGALLGRLQRALGAAAVEASIGMAPYKVATGSPRAWAAADAAMYEDKRRRRSPVPSP